MEERDFLQEICLTCLSTSKAARFAAVVDNNAKLIVGQYRKPNSRPSYKIGDCCMLSHLFYLDYLRPIITKRDRRSNLQRYRYNTGKVEDVHFDLTQINDNVKIAITPLTSRRDRFLCVYFDSSESHQKVIVTLSNSI